MIRGNGVPTFRKPMTFSLGAPKTQLADGLVQTIEYFETLLSDGTVRASITLDQTAEA
jgi:hypothetical protein